MSDKPVSVAQALQNADRLAAMGACQQAAEIYEAVLARFPGNRRAAQGLSALGPVPASPATPPRAVLENLVALFQSQRTEDAIREGLALVRRYPQVPAIYSVLGGAHAQRNEHEQAAEYYAKALELAPRDLPARYNLALMQRALNRLDEAAENFEAVLAVQPSHVDAQAGLGGALARMDRFAEAAESFRAALANNPRHLGALVGLGNALDRMGSARKLPSGIDKRYRFALTTAPLI
ncbi:MAG: tetratricopeptide repeat protein [Paracoccaceae bacterium]|nr:tetratricopeptide repeat protein [Paracoccaceae bacterium]